MPAPLLAAASGDVSALHALEAVEGVLDRPPRALTAALLDYYAPDNDQCGASFLDGSEALAPDTVTAADLFAVTTLGLPVRPSAARRLLYDTPYAADVAHCLSPERLPLDTTLAEAGAEILDAMSALHDAVVSAFGVHPDDAAHGAASAICARKRPELFPALDPALRAALALPTPAAPVRSWLILRSVLSEVRIADGIAAAFSRARRAAHGVLLDVYPLRQIHVLVANARF